MRAAYIAPYQGSALLTHRPIMKNRSLAAAVKIELISEFLRQNAHEVEVFSQGEVVELQFRFYPAFLEPAPFHPDLPPVSYASALPIRRINALWSSLSTLALFRARHRAAPFDVVMIYNFKLPQILCAHWAMRRLGLPVVLEYEDDAFVDVSGQ